MRPEVCDEPTVAAPFEFDTLTGFTGSEDFAFDGNGYLVSTDHNGNLMRMDIEGNKEVFVPGVGETAGTRFLPNGDLVVAQVSRGQLLRITPSGGQETLLGGLSYPNGVEVDHDGMVYVAEHDGGRVRVVDPETGEDSTVATGLESPNGVVMSADQRSLYVNSFGGGTVHVIRRDEAGVWADPELFSEIPRDEAPEEGPCLESAAGDECVSDDGFVGDCVDPGSGELECTQVQDVDPCSGLNEGDACANTLFGEEISSTCSISPADGQLFCPKAPAEALAVCEGASQGDECTLGGETGKCRNSFEELMVCNELGLAGQACDGLAEADECLVESLTNPYVGTCKATGDGALNCRKENDGGGWWERGGLDGMNIDVCDNIYFTEYLVGYIWRTDHQTNEVELAVESNQWWIPNMHWGNGVGGWDPDLMYVMEREQGKLLVVDVGYQGAPTAFQPD